MTQYKRVDGLAVSIDPQEPLVALLSGPTWDSDGYQRAERINGAVNCPGCGDVLPVVEDVCEWQQGADGRYHATEWDTGHAWCDQCDLCIVEGFDHDYVIRLS